MSRTYRFYINGPIGSRFLNYVRNILSTYYTAEGNAITEWAEPYGSYPFPPGSLFEIEIESEFLVDKILELTQIVNSSVGGSTIDVVFAGRPAGAIFIGIAEEDTTSHDNKWFEILVESFRENLVDGIVQTEDITIPE